MMRRRSIQAITWFIVLAPFFGWGGGAPVLSVMSAIMGHSHMMFLGHEHGEAHLLLRHADPHTHSLDALASGDPDTHVTSTEQAEYFDHEIHLSDYDHPLTIATKTPGNLHTSVTTAITSLPVGQIERSLLGSVPWRPPGAHSHLRSLRAVVLLI